MTLPILLVAILCAQIIGAQALPVKQQSPSLAQQGHNLQAIADDVGERIRINPEKTSEIIRQAILSVHQPGNKISPESEAAIIAIVTAA